MYVCNTYIHTYVCIYTYTYIRMYTYIRIYVAITLKKNKKRHFKDVTRGGPCASPLMKQIFNRTQIYEVFTASGRNGWFSLDVT